MTHSVLPVTPEELEILKAVEKKVLWLSTYMIHYANHIRPNPDSIKVGGHQASSSSIVSLLTALMLRTMSAHDRLALKPHASPVFHAVQYLLGHLDKEKLSQFRQFGGIQSYPSRRKDHDGVHFNTGSVGIGGANVIFSAIVQEYAMRHFPGEQTPGKYISLMGDAEMEEGTLYEALLEGQNYSLNHCWWIIDLNRQSLDKLLAANRVGQLMDIFTSMGWEVIVLKYGRPVLDLFEQPGGYHLKKWFDDVSNVEYQTLLRVSPEEYKKALLEAVGTRSKDAHALVDRYDGTFLRQSIMSLGGHDMQMICEAYDRAGQVTDRPVAILAYTIKGMGLPLAAHKDNHSGMLSGAEVGHVREAMGIAEGEEFDAYSGMAESDKVRAYMESSPLHRKNFSPVPANPKRIGVPDRLDIRYKSVISTQGAFGQILLALSRVKDIGERMVTCAPDVSTSTNLGGWINRVGVYMPQAHSDPYALHNLKSPFQWHETPSGRHLELGIAENNFFSLLNMLGLSYELNGTMLFPVGTVYDVFLKRGLDMLNIGIYSESRFILVGTPSGVTLSPEGGVHQSFITPLLGVGFPDWYYYEPAFAQEMEILLCWALDQLQERKSGRPVYFRLTTNPITQPELDYDASLRRQVIEGGYWLRDYRRETDYAQRDRFNVVATGVMVDQALRASDQLREDGIYCNVINVTSPGRLHKGWNAHQRGRIRGQPTGTPHLFELFPVSDRLPMVSVIDGHPLTFDWLGGALGVPHISLGCTMYGESGDIESLYRKMQIHADDIIDAVAQLILGGVTRPAEGRLLDRPFAGEAP
ncbi:MAG: transketolase [SAR324 cluster bacterium]|nr:transketolase [SAR324 cluster bacterium]